MNKETFLKLISIYSSAVTILLTFNDSSDNKSRITFSTIYNIIKFSVKYRKFIESPFSVSDCDGISSLYLFYSDLLVSSRLTFVRIVQSYVAMNEKKYLQTSMKKTKTKNANAAIPCRP